MGKKADIWMPLYVADYLADTAYLTTEQSGAYLHLLMAYWRNGPPPDSDAILAGITKLTPDAWSNARAVLEQYFEVTDGYWINKRLEKELTIAKQNRTVAHDRAVKAASARWSKENASSMLQALPEDMLVQCPSPSPSPSPKQPQSPAPERTPRATRLAESWILPVEWAEWTAREFPSVNIPMEAAKFRDYWVAKSGKDATKNSWEATWRNWCRRVSERMPVDKFQAGKQRLIDEFCGGDNGFINGESRHVG